MLYKSATRYCIRFEFLQEANHLLPVGKHIFSCSQPFLWKNRAVNSSQRIWWAIRSASSRVTDSSQRETHMKGVYFAWDIVTPKWRLAAYLIFCTVIAFSKGPVSNPCQFVSYGYAYDSEPMESEMTEYSALEYYVYIHHLLTQLIPYLHTFTIVSLLLALMADLCLPLSAGEDTFELHSVQLELVAVERQIHELLGKQAQLSERRAMLETSRADAHKSGVSMQSAANTPTTSTPCVSLIRPRAPGTQSSQMSFTPALENHGPWVQQRRSDPGSDDLTASGLRDLHPQPLRSSLQDGTWRCDHRSLHRPARPCYVSWR